MRIQGEYMLIFQRFMTGFYLANDSFKLLIKHKRLILYSLSITIFGLIISFLFTKLFTIDLEQYLMLTPDIPLMVKGLGGMSVVMRLIMAFVVTFIMALYTTFFNVALVHDTMHFVHNQNRTMKEALSVSAHKLSIILQWAFITSLAGTFAYIPLLLFNAAFIERLVAGIILLLAIGVYIWVYLVIPFIALEGVTLIRALALSWDVVKNRIPELIGCQSWIILITFVVGLVLMLPNFLVGFFVGKAQPILFIVVATALQLLANTIIAAAAMVVRTLYYDEFYKKRLDQVALAEHDLMF